MAHSSTWRTSNPAEALLRLQNIDTDNSGDESAEDDDTQLNDADEPQLDLGSESESDTGNEFSSDEESNAAHNTLTSRAGVLWTCITGETERGRANAENVFRQKPGCTPFSYQGVVAGSPLSAFRLFIDEPMLRSIRKYTEIHGKIEDPEFSLTLET